MKLSEKFSGLVPEWFKKTDKEREQAVGVPARQIIVCLGIVAGFLFALFNDLLLPFLAAAALIIALRLLASERKKPEPLDEQQERLTVSVGASQAEPQASASDQSSPDATQPLHHTQSLPTQPPPGEPMKVIFRRRHGFRWKAIEKTVYLRGSIDRRLVRRVVKYLTEGETRIVYLRRLHWSKVVRTAWWALPLWILTIVGTFFTPADWWVELIAVVVISVIFWERWTRWRDFFFVVTDVRALLLYDPPFPLLRNKEQDFMRRATNCSVKDTPLGKVLRYGSFTLETPGQKDTPLHDVAPVVAQEELFREVTEIIAGQRG